MRWITVWKPNYARGNVIDEALYWAAPCLRTARSGSRNQSAIDVGDRQQKPAMPPMP
jgi:hypothetical protein